VKRGTARDIREWVRLAGAVLRISVTGWAYGAAVMWGLIALLRGLAGRAGLAGALLAHVIGPGPRGAVTGFAASMGVPLHWQVSLLRMGGRISPASLMAARPWLAAVVCVPVLAGAVMGWLAAGAAARYRVRAIFLLAASAIGFALIGAAAVAVSGLAGPSGLVSLTASSAWTMLLGAGWAVLGGGLGLVLRGALARRGAPARRGRAHRLPVRWNVARTVAAGGAALLVLGAPLIAAGAAEAAVCAGSVNACKDSFLTALTPPGTAGLDPAGPSASQVTSAGYSFQSYLNTVQAPWMVRETNVYWQDNNRMIQLMLASPALAQQAASTLQTWYPALQAAGTPAANSVVITQAMVDQANALANAFIGADLASSGGALAQSIRTEESQITPSQIVGLTVNQAVAYADQNVG
jgi:hypothetical protein